MKEDVSKNGLTHNEHIGKMAAVTPQIMQYILASYYPAGKYLEAATAPSRRALVATAGRRIIR